MADESFLSDYTHSALLELAKDPDAYRALEPRLLDQLMFFSVYNYGATNDSSLIRVLIPLYHDWAEAVSIENRMHLYRSIATKVEAREISPNALLPFLNEEEETAIVSSAAIDLAMTHPIENDDPLTGPKVIVTIIKRGMNANAAGAFAGLLLIGDRRVCHLLWGIRDVLGEEGLSKVSRARTGFLSAPTIEFWLDWLEEIVEDPHQQGTFGTIAAALANGPTTATVHAVLDAERIFSCAPGSEGNRLLHRWTMGEYFERIHPRLSALSNRESPPKVIPQVIAAWDAVKHMPAPWKSSGFFSRFSKA